MINSVNFLSFFRSNSKVCQRVQSSGMRVFDFVCEKIIYVSMKTVQMTSNLAGMWDNLSFDLQNQKRERGREMLRHVGVSSENATELNVQVSPHFLIKFRPFGLIDSSILWILSHSGFQLW